MLELPLGDNDPDELQPGELAVVLLALQGKTNKAIAKALGVSVPAVEKLRRNAMKTLGVSKCSELVRLANRQDSPLAVYGLFPVFVPFDYFSEDSSDLTSLDSSCMVWVHF